MAVAYLNLDGLSNFKDKLDTIYGATLSITGTTVSLTSKAGAVLGSATMTIPKYNLVTQTADGLLSSADKIKLDGISTGATKTAGSGTNGSILVDGASVTVYTHPSATARDSGFYKVTVDGKGHVTNVTAVTKADITALGIPAQNTTYADATTDVHGLMSTADKTKINGVAAGAQVNVIESVKVNGAALAISSKAVNIDLSSYATKSMISNAVNYKGSVDTYAKLPTSPANGDMYNVTAADDAHGIDAGENVIWDGSKWDPVGSSFSISAISNTQIDSLFT